MGSENFRQVDGLEAEIAETRWMVGVAFDFRYGAIAYSRQEPASDATVGTVGFFPVFDDVALIFVHDEIPSAATLQPKEEELSPRRHEEHECFCRVRSAHRLVRRPDVSAAGSSS